MELRQYWRIIWRKIWIPVLLVALVTAVSVATKKTPPPTYTSSLSFIVGVKPERVEGQFNYDGYYAGISSEFIADDMSRVVSSQAFAQDVNRHLRETGSSLQIPPGVLSGLTFADKQHRVLQVNLSWGDPAQLQEIGQATMLAVEQDAPKYMAQLVTFGSNIIVIDPPSPPTPIPASLTQRLDLPVRLLLALIAGIGLIFLLHYLDTSVHTVDELEALGIKVLAEIPKQKR